MTTRGREIELLAPAASLEVGRVALSAGADAVYIGAPRFGARSAAGVSLADIGTLAYEAHAVGAKLYVAVNTILSDSEMAEAVEIIHQLYEVGADAIIVQDMGLMLQELPPIPLHASTQCHNDSRGKLKLLEQLGIEQVVLPRELGSADLPPLIEGIDIRVESFVHGALCVSYSGRCFISEACRGRSANRGACAQYCRMSYDLIDAEGQTLLTSQHLLSLKDLNRSEILEELLASGVSSFKIEGRLKGIDYVRNVTAHYRERLDEIIANSDGRYQRSSWGKEKYLFTPQPKQTFSRLFTNYNTPMHQPIPMDSITSFTNKSVGEEIGTLLEESDKEVLIRLKQTETTLSNGDGLLFVDKRQKETEGALINQVTQTARDTYRLKLSSPITVGKGATVYRNLNHQLNQLLLRPNASSRKVPIDIICTCHQKGVKIEAYIAERRDIRAIVTREIPLDIAKKDNTPHLHNTLSKLGNTPYTTTQVELQLQGYYLPPSLLTELRREVIDKLLQACHTTFMQERDERGTRLQKQRELFLSHIHQPEEYHLPQQLDFTYNVANKWATQFYRNMGVTGSIAPALEISKPQGTIPVMYTRHCLMHQIGYCTRDRKKPPFTLPLYLVRGNERFRVTTNCRDCMMTLWKDE